MTSPIPPQVSDKETAEVYALSPSMKIFSAATIIICGAAIAVVFWKASLDYGFIDSITNPMVDKRISTAPMPTLVMQDKNSSIEASLPSLSQTPTIDEGSGKYTQMYPPPPILEMAKSSKDAEKHLFPDKTEKTDVEKPVLRDNTKFAPIYKVPNPPPPEKSDDLGKIQKKPPVAPDTGTNDRMIALFQFADNYEPSRKVEQGLPSGLPENPFLTTPSPGIENRSDVNSDLVPLQFLRTPELQALKTVDSSSIELQPLKIVPKQ